VKATTIIFLLGQSRLALSVAHKGRHLPAKYLVRAIYYAQDEARRRGVPYLGIAGRATEVSTRQDGSVEVYTL